MTMRPTHCDVIFFSTKCHLPIVGVYCDVMSGTVIWNILLGVVMLLLILLQINSS